MRLELNLDPDGEIATVTLSRRNLLSMLHKLDMQGSARTLMADMPCGARLVLMAEDDDEHYEHTDRDPSVAGIPGPMHPATETFIERTTA